MDSSLPFFLVVRRIHWPVFLPSSGKDVFDRVVLPLDLGLLCLLPEPIFSGFKEHPEPATRESCVGGFCAQHVSHFVIARPVSACNVESSQVADDSIMKISVRSVLIGGDNISDDTSKIAVRQSKNLSAVHPAFCGLNDSSQVFVG